MPEYFLSCLGHGVFTVCRNGGIPITWPSITLLHWHYQSAGRLEISANFLSNKFWLLSLHLLEEIAKFGSVILYTILKIFVHIVREAHRGYSCCLIRCVFLGNAELVKSLRQR